MDVGGIFTICDKNNLITELQTSEVIHSSKTAWKSQPFHTKSAATDGQDEMSLYWG
jgi:hypothetical protein